MPYKIRRSEERKHFDHGWLNTYHTFSFASYYDPNFMGFRDLRVINEDRVAPSNGFPLHDHRDMEIISIVLEGELAHQDSTGTEAILKPNEVQTMSAGTGITHSEYNPSKTKPVHFLQIWILPDAKNVTPGYQQAYFPTDKPNHWQLVASKSGKDHSLKIHQDVELYTLSLDKGKKELLKIKPDRYGWVQVISGELSFNKDILRTGDGVAIDPKSEIALIALAPTKLLFFDLK